MTANTQQLQRFRESLFKDITQSERLAIDFKVFQPLFSKGIQQLLTDYNLAASLTAAGQPSGQKLRILELSCAEGLFLHELARLLDEQELSKGATLFGISEDPYQIATAESYSQVSNPPRPYLNFFNHDLHQPLAECVGLQSSFAPTASCVFDIIFGPPPHTLNAVKDANTVLTRLYQDNLKPGGLMYFTEFIAQEGASGWEAPHPALAALLRVTDIPQKLFNPVPVAFELSNWFQVLGAEQILHYETALPCGGTTEGGRLLMQAVLLFLRLLGPAFVQAGLLTQAEYDGHIQTLHREITPAMVGTARYITVLARKPLD